MQFKKASRQHVYVKMMISGKSKTGKTLSCLRIAHAYLGGKSTEQDICVIDTQEGQAHTYADTYDDELGCEYKFQVLELSDHSPNKFIAAIKLAEKNGFKVCIIDTASDEWVGHNGILDQANKLARAGSKGVQPWSQVTPMHEEFVRTIRESRMHIFATFRSKDSATPGVDAKTGKKIIEKVDDKLMTKIDVSYEFDIECKMDRDNYGSFVARNIPELNNNVFRHPAQKVANILREWSDPEYYEARLKEREELSQPVAGKKSSTPVEDTPVPEHTEEVPPVKTAVEEKIEKDMGAVALLDGGELWMLAKKTGYTGASAKKVLTQFKGIDGSPISTFKEIPLALGDELEAIFSSKDKLKEYK